MRIWQTFLAASTLLLAGCSAGPSDGHRALEDALGDGSLGLAGGSPVILGTVLEGRLVGVADSWSSGIEQPLAGEPIVVGKDAIGPGAGGGVSIPLAAPAANVTLEVRFASYQRLGGFEMRWTMIEGAQELARSRPSWGPAVAPDETFQVALDSIGRFAVYALVMSDGAAVAVTQQPLVVARSAHWIVDSSIYPRRAPDTQPPANYPEMADDFVFEVPMPGASIDVATEFRGDWQPGMGTDVDLGLHGPAAAQCIGAGGNAQGTPDPAESSEALIVDRAVPGTWIARVGAMRDCLESEWTYNNAGEVPYRLDLAIIYFLAGSPSNLPGGPA